MEVAWIERSAYGEVVPTPSWPFTFTLANCAVEDAWSPAWNQMGVEVALAVAPKLLVPKNQFPTLAAPEHDCVVTTPDPLTVRHCPAPEPRLEIVRLVVEARVVESVVEVASTKSALLK